MQRITNQSLYQNVPDQWQLAGASFPVMKADQLMAGLNWTHGQWNVDVEVYTKRTQGQVLNASAGQYTNTGFNGFYTGSAYVRGIDAAVQWERPPHRLLASFSRIWAESHYDGFEQQQIQETYIRGAEGKVVYEWKRGAWSASILLLAAQGAPYTALLGTYDYLLPDGSSRLFPLFGSYNGARTSPYLRADVVFGYRWQWWDTRWQIHASVYNVFDSPNYRSMQYSIINSTTAEPSINQRQIRMLGRIPTINLTCQF
jgi:hypothetical protein